ncbi:MAG TPA: cytochrome b [Burkholderiales bacterium]|nr:cytochrome b [Burkholderiales bacterium]
MSAEKPAERYAPVAVFLHWAVALLIFCSFPVGLYMVDLKLSPWKLRIYSYHKWIGVTVFLLVLARVAWRTGHAAPPLPASVPAWERHLAGSMHLLLYLLLFAIPLSGWLFSSAAGVQTVYFALLPLPDLVPKDKMLADLFRFIHMFLNYSFAGLVGLHAAAALKHHFLDRDTVLTRMVPGLNPRNLL